MHWNSTSVSRPPSGLRVVVAAGGAILLTVSLAASAFLGAPETATQQASSSDSPRVPADARTTGLPPTSSAALSARVGSGTDKQRIEEELDRLKASTPSPAATPVLPRIMG